jgi:hypothetical protein
MILFAAAVMPRPGKSMVATQYNDMLLAYMMLSA